MLLSPWFDLRHSEVKWLCYCSSARESIFRLIRVIECHNSIPVILKLVANYWKFRLEHRDRAMKIPWILYVVKTRLGDALLCRCSPPHRFQSTNPSVNRIANSVSLSARAESDINTSQHNTAGFDVSSYGMAGYMAEESSSGGTALGWSVWLCWFLFVW